MVIILMFNAIKILEKIMFVYPKFVPHFLEKQFHCFKLCRLSTKHISISGSTQQIHATGDLRSRSGQGQVQVESKFWTCAIH